MEPQIRYTRTSDGISIAYWTLGTGPPLIYLPPLAHHVQLDWRFPPLREMYAWLSRRHRLARFDFRGRGMSERGDIVYTHETELLDLDAVVSELGLDSFILFAGGTGAGAGVRYAARHPKSVQRLVITGGFVPVAVDIESASIQSMRALLPIDYEIYIQVLAQMVWGWQGGERTRQYAALLRASQSHEQALRGFGFGTAESMEDFARSVPLIASPTLLVYQRTAIFSGAESAQRLAAEIPGARLVLLEGDSQGGFYADPLMMAAVDEFLGGLSGSGGAPAQLPSGMAVILFLDIAGSTALTERMGDAPFRDASRAVDAGVRAAMRQHGGTPVEGKVLGDGVMGVFGSAAAAIQAARRCLELGGELPMHVGLHAGDVIREDENVYGGAVNIAARVCDISAPGEILVSGTVRDLARTSAGVSFEDRGERTLKGIDDPVRVFAVRQPE